MLHKHLLIECDRNASVTRGLVVYCYDGLQGRRDYLALIALAVDAGYYFERVSDASESFFRRCLVAAGLCPHVQHVRARDYLKARKSPERCRAIMLDGRASHAQNKAISDNYQMSCVVARCQASESVTPRQRVNSKAANV